MIPAHELRIGNKVAFLLEGRKVATIIGIQPAGVRVDSFPYGLYSLEDIEPISITEEILPESFKPDEYGVKKHYPFGSILASDATFLYNDDGLFFGTPGEPHMVEFKYVHTFQNFYYFLTQGAELEFKL